MMRGVSNWAVAVRKPSPEQIAAGASDATATRDGAPPPLGEVEVTTYPLDSAMKRHRLLRLPLVRGVVALGGSMVIGFRALEISANAQLPPDEAAEAEGQQRFPAPCGLAPWWSRCAGGRAVLPDPRGLTSLIKEAARFLGAVLGGRGARFARPCSSATCPALAGARPAAGVRVPRRRAQDDLLLRGGLAADARQRPALLAAAPSLRHQLPAGRDDRRDLRVRADRAARVVLADADPRVGVPADRRDLLRADQVRRAEPQPRAGCGR